MSNVLNFLVKFSSQMPIIKIFFTIKVNVN